MSVSVDPEPFRQRFSTSPELAIRVPGRVNLIGGHLDYHEGFVLPLAIDRSLVLLGRQRTDQRVRVYSQGLSLGVDFDLEQPERHPTPLGRYCQGAIAALRPHHSVRWGCDVLISGDLPPGAGLSSSSALVVGFTAALAHLHGHELPPRELAQIGRAAEHWYGTTGGIMDQYVLTHGRQGHALLIDCRYLSHHYVPIPESAAIVIAHTGAPRQQIATPFALRRQEAEAALAVLQALVPGIKTLRDVEPPLLERHRQQLLASDPSGLLLRRCQHVVWEETRVLAAAEALRHADLPALGALMKEAHASLRDNYEVSSPELETMFSVAVSLSGCYGARMTGGGFGGCVVGLVATEAANTFCQSLKAVYAEATGLEPAVFPTSASEALQVEALP